MGDAAFVGNDIVGRGKAFGRNGQLFRLYVGILFDNGAIVHNGVFVGVAVVQNDSERQRSYNEQAHIRSVGDNALRHYIAQRVHAVRRIARQFLTMRFYSMACCVVMLFLIFATFREGGLKYDLNVIEQLERKRSEQYEMSRESIDIINNKCHDLKKLIGIITASKAHIPDAELEAINRELETYDAIVKTGNKAFDTIVTEKSLYCNGNGIKLSIVADVKSLDFIGDIDMYSLFGNILDNAIEATLKLDESRRSISVVVRDVKGFVSVHAENCYDGEELSFKNGIPQTTKKDASQHGFGVLSIRRIAKKYGGSISVAAEDGIFTVDVLIPISIGE